MSKSSIALIVVNWNGRDLLASCLTSILSQSVRAETVVVDNGSIDGSADWVRETYPEVRLVALGTNEGFCGGNSAGLAVSQSELVMLLNTDAELAPGALAALIAAADDFPDAGSFACRMVRHRDRSRMDNAGLAVGLSGRARQVGAGDPVGDHGTPRYVFGASGGAVVYRRAMLNEIGFLDETFFSHVEDVDLAWRAQLAGFRCRYVPEAVVYHIGAASSTHVSEQVLYRIQRNTTWAFLINTPAVLLPLLAPLHAAYSLYWIGRATLKAQGGIVARAKRDALLRWPELRKRRRTVQRLRKRSAFEVLKAYVTP